MKLNHELAWDRLRTGSDCVPGAHNRDVPLPTAVVAELASNLVSRGLDEDPDASGNRGAFLLGKASDFADRAPGLSAGHASDPRQGIAATTFYN